MVALGQQTPKKDTGTAPTTATQPAQGTTAPAPPTQPGIPAPPTQPGTPAPPTQPGAPVPAPQPGVTPQPGVPEPGTVPQPPQPEVQPAPPVTPPDLHTIAADVAKLTVPVVWNLLPRFGLSLFARADQTEGQPAQGVALPPTYSLGPGDELAVRCFSDALEHLNTTVVISPEGRLYIPLLGEVPVGDGTLSAARVKIGTLLRQFYPKAQVTVDVSRPRVVDIYVLGDVMHPGKYSLPGTGTLFTALYAAGGPSDIGSLRRLKLLPVHGEPQVYDLYSYLLEGDRVSQQPLNPGDTLFVGTQQAEVGVVGEVRRPARYEVMPNTTCAELLKIAGGIAPMAYTPDVQVWRVKDGAYRTIEGVSLQQANDFILRDGDLVAVKPVLDEARQIVTVEGAVRRPGVYDLGANMRVADLVAKAEGPSDKAHLGRAVLWRLDRNLHWEMQSLRLDEALAGNAADNVALQASDRLRVFTQKEAEWDQEVFITGPVRNPGDYQWGGGMKVGDLVALAGGLTPEAYGARAFLWRLNEQMDYVLTTFSLEQAVAGGDTDEFTLKPQDRVVVLAKADVRPLDEVTIAGAVRKPGSYEWGAGMHVSDLVLRAGGVLADAYGHQATLIRFRETDTEREIVQVRLTDALQGNKAADLALSRGDVLRVYTKDEMRVNSEVWIDGYVMRPGNYARYENMRISDLIFAAGGLTPGASGEGVHSLARQVGKTQTTTFRVTQQNEQITVTPDLILGDDDYVALSGLGGFVGRPPHVKITGRVGTPGAYSLATNEGQRKTVYDVLQEAGGLLPDAYAPGILLFRPKSDLWLNRGELLQKVMAAFNRMAAPAAAEPGTTMGDAEKAQVEKTALGNQAASVLVKATGYDQQVGVIVPPRNLSLAALVDIVPVNGDLLVSSKGKQGDTIVEDGDLIVVQRRLNTVAVLGAVAQSGEIAFEPNETPRAAIQRAGGRTDDADLGYVTILRANGTALPEARVRLLEPGDIVLVPSRYLVKAEGAPRSLFDRMWRALMQGFALSRLLN